MMSLILARITFHWPTVTCWSSPLEFVCFTVKVFLPYHKISGSFRVCTSTEWTNDNVYLVWYSWKFNNNATFFYQCCSFLRQTPAGSDFIKLWRGCSP